MARDMIEKFGNPVPIDEPVRKSFNRGRPATVPSTHAPIVWDTPYDTDASGNDGTANRFFSKGNERLYEAYSQLHNMAQEFDKPFDSPAILVVGHQTDGKSALVEALMGFQFNHVGGGTKTRRPVALNMKYVGHPLTSDPTPKPNIAAPTRRRANPPPRRPAPLRHTHATRFPHQLTA